MKEIWKDIKGFKGHYKISNKGRVKSVKRKVLNRGCWRIIGGNILKPRPTKQGYLLIALYKNSLRDDFVIHRLVAEAFISNKKNKKEVNHINYNKSDNNVSNLEWVTPSENVRHSYKFGNREPIRGEKQVNSKLKESDILEIRKKYNSGGYTHRGLAKDYNCCKTNIAFIVNNKHWTHI